MLCPDDYALAPLAIWRLTAFQMLHRGSVLLVFRAALAVPCVHGTIPIVARRS